MGAQRLNQRLSSSFFASKIARNPEPENPHSAHAIVVRMNDSTTNAAEQTVGQYFLLVSRLLDNPGVLQKALKSKEEDWRFLVFTKFS